MTKLTLDAATLAKLHHLAESMEIWDESGKLLGYIQPAAAAREPRISKEEIARRLQQRGGRSLAEILADLEKNA
jgi:hypothetical protein